MNRELFMNSAADAGADLFDYSTIHAVCIPDSEDDSDEKGSLALLMDSVRLFCKFSANVLHEAAGLMF